MTAERQESQHAEGLRLLQIAKHFCALVAEPDGDDPAAVAWWQGHAYGCALELYDDAHELLAAARLP